MNIRKLFLLAAFSPAAIFAAESNFNSAVYTEVVKDVNTVYGTTGKAEKAKSGVGFTKDDAVKSGRGSRAQLTVPDGTVIRVGPNAVFALDKSSRALKLESGSVLFYSPPGAGGGRIVTDSVSCAVTGTTIVVTNDSVTGTTLQVLEGHAKMTRKDGVEVDVDAGQSATNPIGFTGPIVTKNFSPSQMKGAILVSGFSTPLASASKIVDAIGGLPVATPAETASGIDTAQSGSGAPAITVSNNNGPSSTPAVSGQPVIPNTTITTGVRNPSTGQPISPNGEGQIN